MNDDDSIHAKMQRATRIEDMPENEVRALIEKFSEVYPGDICYRSTANRGHYMIRTYMRNKDNNQLGMTLMHGRDSYLPGVFYPEWNPDTVLVRCGCGEWKPPTPEQIEVTRARLAAEAEAGMHHECDDPDCLLGGGNHGTGRHN